MKSILALVLPLAASAVSSPPVSSDTVKQLHARQTGSLFGALPLLFGNTFDKFPVLPSIRTEELKPQIRPDAKRIRISWGPATAYTAKDVRPDYVSYFPSEDEKNPSDTGFANVITAIPTDITMLWARVDLTDKEGQSMANDDKGIYMHHLFFYQLNSEKVKKEFCYGSHTNWVGYLSRKSPNIMLGGGSGETALGERFTSMDGKFNSGYYLPADARFLVQGEVVNTFNTTQYLYPMLEIEYLPGKPEGLKDVSMMMFSVTNCTTENPTIAFIPPKGRRVFDMTSDKFPLPEDGYIINQVGHMHDGGKRITAKLNDKIICDSKAIYGKKNNTMPMAMGGGHMKRHGSPGGQETIIEMTNCTDIIPVKKGDIMQLQGFYDLDTHADREASGAELGAMGIFVMYFAKEEQEARKWGSWKL